eukprot:scaffold83431_cov63-Phaeocystis_antarctica.AAC.2
MPGAAKPCFLPRKVTFSNIRIPQRTHTHTTHTHSRGLRAPQYTETTPERRSLPHTHHTHRHPRLVALIHWLKHAPTRRLHPLPLARESGYEGLHHRGALRPNNDNNNNSCCGIIAQSKRGRPGSQS